MKLSTLFVALALLLFASDGSAQDGPYEALGQVGGGIFKPSGTD